MKLLIGWVLVKVKALLMSFVGLMNELNCFGLCFLVGLVLGWWRIGANFLGEGCLLLNFGWAGAGCRSDL